MAYNLKSFFLKRVVLELTPDGWRRQAGILGEDTKAQEEVWRRWGDMLAAEDITLRRRTVGGAEEGENTANWESDAAQGPESDAARNQEGITASEQQDFCVGSPRNEMEKNGHLPTLWITDDPGTAKHHVVQNDPLLCIYVAGCGADEFEGEHYFVEDLPEVGAEYLDRIYRRHAGIPWDILETERCFLRETTVEDVDAFYDIYAEPSITEYMEDLFPDRDAERAYTQEYIEKIYKLYEYGVWTVCLKETGEVIGRAGLSHREGYEPPELGFVIGVPWQRQGIAKEVCKGILEYGERELDFREVIAFVEPENRVSGLLLEKLGFKPGESAWLLGKEHILWRRRK